MAKDLKKSGASQFVTDEESFKAYKESCAGMVSDPFMTYFMNINSNDDWKATARIALTSGELNYSEKTPELRLPVAISVLGDTDSYYCDYYVDTTYDYSIPVFGGGYQTQERAGIFHWNCAQTYNSANADVGSRLARSF